MPKCLRKEETCPAPFDEFGLLCKSCGQCSLQDLQEEAERMGYAVLIAEGSALVMSIIETGKIDAIVGVSCLSVLEKAFPFMESAAIPGVAIPLLQDDCANTNIDMDWLWEAIHVSSDDKTYRLDLDALRNEVQTWFAPDELNRLCGPTANETERIARDWLGRDGKRWRPFLTACAWRALQDDPDAPMTDDLKRLAIAVECFHKASLIHDDIEDADETRYDQPTVHAEHGIPVALNAGDLLLGEGYRLIGLCEAEPASMVEMLRVASAGHRDLCLGQGDELSWHTDPAALKTAQVIEIFRRKTAPAFEVALRLGAALAEADAATHEALTAYSENLGVAYQIRDDLDDWTGGEGTPDAEAGRPTLLPAIALERASAANRSALQTLWLQGSDPESLRTHIADSGAVERARELLTAYKEQSVRALRDVQNATLKGLLRRVMTKIFNDLQIKGWCSESETANASSSASRSESAA